MHDPLTVSPYIAEAARRANIIPIGSGKAHPPRLVTPIDRSQAQNKGGQPRHFPGHPSGPVYVPEDWDIPEPESDPWLMRCAMTLAGIFVVIGVVVVVVRL